MSSSLSSVVCHHFSLDEIKDATNNFDVSNILGEGGEGIVYLGHIAIGGDNEKIPVAVKHLSPNSIEFEREIKIVSKIQHPNLVSLLGYCNELDQKILIYEYMQRGSLSDYVKKKISICLSWKQRLNICLGAARGLQYLHTATVELPKGIIHRDMKPANILLDKNWVAKVSDFGMFKLSHAGQTNSTMFTDLKGTCGYYAPEYFRTFQITRKIDVYAFGVVLFEVLCRKKPWDRGDDQSYYVRDDEDLGLWAQENVDTEINGEISDDSLDIFADIVGKSLRPNPGKRPTMDKVVLDLERALKCQEREDDEGIRPKAPSGRRASIPSNVQKQIQNIKKITGNSEDEIYAMLKECSMDLLETIEKLGIIGRKANNGATTELVESSNTTIPAVNTGMIQENVDALIKSITDDFRSSQGKPVPALTIYKCLIHWKSFEVESTPVFDRLVQMISSIVSENEPDNKCMAYWLCNTSTLLVLLQGSFRSTASIPRKSSVPPTSLFQRMAQGFRSSPSSANLPVSDPGVARHVEPKYPALLFKQQLTAFVEKIYGIIRDNLKKDLAPLLSLCIKFPRTLRGKDTRSTSLMLHWQSIIDSLNRLLSTLKENYVPSILVQRIFSQAFSFMNVQIFNSFLLRRECCSFVNGEFVKAGLAELEIWCCETTEAYAGSSYDELKHVRQAVGFLVTHQKYTISYDEIANDLCPVLSVQQLYRISTMYWDDKYNTRSVAPDVISTMRVLMTEDSNNTVSSSFLLDDDSSIPFTVEDIYNNSNTHKEKDFSDVKPVGDLVKNPAFRFLQD